MCVIEMIQSKGFNGALREMAAVLNGASVPQSTPSRAPFKCRSGRYVSDPFSIIHHSLYLHYSSASSCRSSSCRSSPTFYLLLLLLLVLFVDWVLTPQTSAVEIGGRFSPPPSLPPSLPPSRPPSFSSFFCPFRTREAGFRARPISARLARDVTTVSRNRPLAGIRK